MRVLSYNLLGMSLLPEESRWYFQLFGGFEARWGALRVNRFRTAKTASLLAFLVSHPPHRFAREMLANQFWDDLEPERARNNLSVALNALRHALDAPGAPLLIEADSQWVRLNPEAFYADVVEFEQAIQLASTASDPAQQYEHYAYAVNLYQGEFMPDWYDSWIVQKAAELQAECLSALEQLAQIDLERGNAESARRWLARLVSINPLDLDAMARLMELHLQARQYEVAAQLGTVWIEQYQRLTGGAPPLRIQQLTQEALHRSQERIRLPSPRVEARPDKPALMTTNVENSAVATTSLPPLPRTRFVGREQETADLLERLADPAVPCTTIIGLGGVGKTRFALEIAHKLQVQGETPIHWVALTAITQAEQIIPLIAQTLGLLSPSNLIHSLQRYSAEHRPLLFLDNFEHLLPDGARIIAELLRGAPGMRVCITSRLPLRIESETLFPLAPLPCDDTPDCPALTLFVERAKQIDHDFRLNDQNRLLILELCRQLNGIPLALELAAARLNTLSPKQMLQSVHDRLHWLRARRTDIEARHRTMLGVLETTVATLPSHARRALAQLSLLQDSWSLAWAQTATGLSMEHLMEALEMLLATSLIERVPTEPPCYRMLEIVRDYAQTLLSDAQRRAVENRLCARTLQIATQCAPQAYTAQLPEWLAFWDATRAQLFQTLEILEKQNRLHDALRLIRATERYFYLRPLPNDILHRVQRWLISGKLSPRDIIDARLIQLRLLFEMEQLHLALPIAQELAGLDRRDKRRGWALYWIVQIAFTLRDHPTARTYWRQLRRHFPCAHHPQLHHAIHYLWGYLEPVEDIIAWREEGVQFARQTGDPLLLGGALDALIEPLMFLGEYTRAQRFLEETRTLYTRLQDQLHLDGVLHGQVYCWLQQGDLIQAQQTLDVCLEQERQLGLPTYSTHWLQAVLWRWEGKPAQAQQLALSEVANLEAQQIWHIAALMLEVAALCAADLGNLNDALAHAADAMRLREREDDRTRLYFTRTHYAYLRARAGEPEAVKELEACLQYWREQGWRPWQATTLQYLAEAYALHGEPVRAQSALEEAILLNRAMGRALALQKCQNLKNLLPI
ncbi:MAG: winged helix-turn-helix domain-containing protein [Fimbriimonadales bacterium]|nr:winged helix-turn-helix domain-containing protein [Fimbriimonadales bacterium]